MWFWKKEEAGKPADQYEEKSPKPVRGVCYVEMGQTWKDNHLIRVPIECIKPSENAADTKLNVVSTGSGEQTALTTWFQLTSGELVTCLRPANFGNALIVQPQELRQEILVADTQGFHYVGIRQKNSVSQGLSLS